MNCCAQPILNKTDSDVAPPGGQEVCIFKPDISANLHNTAGYMPYFWTWTGFQ